MSRKNEGKVRRAGPDSERQKDAHCQADQRLHLPEGSPLPDTFRPNNQEDPTGRHHKNEAQAEKAQAPSRRRSDGAGRRKDRAHLMGRSHQEVRRIPDARRYVRALRKIIF